MNHTHANRHVHLISLIFFLLTLQSGFSAINGFGNRPYTNARPFRLSYFGYGFSNPGFYLGTEFNVSWLKLETVKCTRGARIDDHQWLLSPQAGYVSLSDKNCAIFGNMELCFRDTHYSGFFVEIFASGGYALTVNSPAPGVPGSRESGRNVNAANGLSGAFMPGAGFGSGFNFQKVNSKDVPLILDFRVLSSSISRGGPLFNPSFQAGIIYGF